MDTEELLLDASVVTSYGASSTSPRAACSVLRARADAAGLRCSPVSDLDAAAAVIGAHTWALAHRTTSLDAPARFGEGAVRSLAAVLARAAGHGAPPSDPTGCAHADDDLWVLQAEASYNWAETHLQGSGAEAVRLAVADLSNAGDGCIESSVAATLWSTVDGISLDLADAG